MSATRKIALNLLGIGLTLGGVIVLLLGLLNVMIGWAWGNGSAGDLFLVFLFALYAIPGGFGSIRWGIVLLRSTNEETYVPPAAGSQRRLGICLLLPAIAALALLMMGYPHYRYWAFGEPIGIFLALLAVAFFVGGIHLLKDAHRPAQM